MAKDFTGCTLTNHISDSQADRVARFLIETAAAQNQQVVTKWSKREWKSGDNRLVECLNGVSTTKKDITAVG